MTTNAGAVRDPTLAKFIDAMISIIRLPDGETPDAPPDAWKGTMSQQINANDTDEFRVTFHVKPGGLTASCLVQAMSSQAKSIQGSVDIEILSTILV